MGIVRLAAGRSLGVLRFALPFLQIRPRRTDCSAGFAHSAGEFVAALRGAFGCAAAHLKRTLRQRQLVGAVEAERAWHQEVSRMAGTCSRHGARISMVSIVPQSHCGQRRRDSPVSASYQSR